MLGWTARIRGSACRAIVPAAVLCLVGCGEFSSHRAKLAGDYAAGWFDAAARDLDAPETIDLYGNKNRLLYELDRGAVALAMGDYDKSIDLLNQAEDRIDYYREKTLGDQIGQWTLNDTTSSYVAEPYEDMYTNVLKIIAQFGAGRIQGGATVEARRIGSKADRLRDEYLQYKEQVQKESKDKLGENAQPRYALSASNDEGNFVESPLGTYLAAVAFMKSGNGELQRVAGKRLVESIRIQAGLIGPVKDDDFADIEERRPESVNVLVVALSGRGPTKYAEKIGPIPVGTFPVYFELPKLQTNLSTVAAARVEVEGASPGEACELKFIEDMSSVAIENHKRTLPLIYARTLIRAGVKAGLSATATELTRKNARDNNKGLIQVAGAVAGLVFLATTERADLRSWIFLPGQARVGLLKLPAGQHRVRVVYESHGGGIVYTTPWHNVTTSDDGLSSVITQYWN